MARRVVAVVLAAGNSMRFGGDKLLHVFNGRPLGEHVAVTLEGMALAGRIAVCPVGRRVLFVPHGFEIVDNPHSNQGMGTSLALGAAHAIELDADALLVCLADMPLVTREHLDSLLATDANVVATETASVRSPPIVFGRSVLPDLIALSGDTGPRHLLKAAATVKADPSMVRDFDMPEDFA